MLTWPHAKDPDGECTLTAEWGDFLDGAIIDASIWNLPAGLTKLSSTFSNIDAFVKVSGGVPGENYECENIMTDSTGDKWPRTIILKVKER